MEKRKKRSFTEEFKIEAVRRSEVVGVSKTSTELDVCQSALRRWKKQYSDNPEQSSAIDNKPTYKDLEKENKKLKRELGYMQEINRILKKSTAIFSSDQMGGLK